MPEGKALNVFVLFTSNPVSLTETLVKFVAAHAWGDHYHRYIPSWQWGQLGVCAEWWAGNKERKLEEKIINASCGNDDDQKMWMSRGRWFWSGSVGSISFRYDPAMSRQLMKPESANLRDSHLYRASNSYALCPIGGELYQPDFKSTAFTADLFQIWIVENFEHNYS